MQITRYSDYSLRVLIFLAAHAGRRQNIADIAQYFGISRNHLVKVVHHLAKIGAVESARGRGGGIRLARPPEEINVGDIVRKTEQTLDIVNCSTPHCTLLPACTLRRVFTEAQAAFFAVLDAWTIADLVRDPRQFATLPARTGTPGRRPRRRSPA